MILKTKSTDPQCSLTIIKDEVSGYRLKASMKVFRPIEEVFGFFSDAMQLEKITPPWLKFSVLTPSPVEMKAGTLLDYKLRLRGIPIRWQTEICDWEPCHRFVDQQLKGPYRKWWHEHTFESVADGTMVYDNVHYIVPGGSLINRLFVGPDVEKIFRFRQNALDRILNKSIQS